MMVMAIFLFIEAKTVMTAFLFIEAYMMVMAIFLFIEAKTVMTGFLFIEAYMMVMAIFLFIEANTVMPVLNVILKLTPFFFKSQMPRGFLGFNHHLHFMEGFFTHP